MVGLLSFQVNPLFYYITTVLTSPNTRDDSPLLFRPHLQTWDLKCSRMLAWSSARGLLLMVCRSTLHKWRQARTQSSSENTLCRCLAKATWNTISFFSESIPLFLLFFFFFDLRANVDLSSWHTIGGFWFQFIINNLGRLKETKPFDNSASGIVSVQPSIVLTVPSKQVVYNSTSGDLSFAMTNTGLNEATNVTFSMYPEPPSARPSHPSSICTATFIWVHFPDMPCTLEALCKSIKWCLTIQPTKSIPSSLPRHQCQACYPLHAQLLRSTSRSSMNLRTECFKWLSSLLQVIHQRLVPYFRVPPRFSRCWCSAGTEAPYTSQVAITTAESNILPTCYTPLYEGCEYWYLSFASTYLLNILIHSIFFKFSGVLVQAIGAQQVIFGQNLTVAVTASCLNCLTAVDFVVVSSPLPSELHLDANTSDSGKTTLLSNLSVLPLSLFSLPLSPFLFLAINNDSSGSFVFTTTTSCQLLVANSGQTIINSNVTIGLEDSLNLANPIIYSEESFALTVYGMFWQSKRV